MQALAPRPAGCTALQFLCYAARHCCTLVPGHQHETNQGTPALLPGATTSSSSQASPGGLQQQVRQQLQQQQQQSWQLRDPNKAAIHAYSSAQAGKPPHKSSGLAHRSQPTPPQPTLSAQQRMLWLHESESLLRFSVDADTPANGPCWHRPPLSCATYHQRMHWQQAQSIHHPSKHIRRQFHSQQPPEVPHSTPAKHPQTQQTPQQPADSASAPAADSAGQQAAAAAAAAAAGHTVHDTSGPQQQLPGAAFTTLPNMLSLSRVAMSPWLAYCIAAQQWPTAVALTAAAGVSDWLDGFLARKMGHTSKLGSYVDPLADKVFVATAVGTMGALDMVPAWLAVLVVGRDSAQVVGMFWYRLRMFGGVWPGASTFFNVDHAVQTSAPPSNTSSSSSSSSSSNRSSSRDSSSCVSDADQATTHSSSFSAESTSSSAESAEDSSSRTAPMRLHISSSQQGANSHEAHHSSSSSSSSSSHSGSAPTASAQQPATGGQLPMIRPLLISKANTALIMALVAACMGHQWQGFPDRDVLEALEFVAASTTAVSAAAYARLHWQGRLLAPAAKADKQ